MDNCNDGRISIKLFCKVEESPFFYNTGSFFLTTKSPKYTFDNYAEYTVHEKKFQPGPPSAVFKNWTSFRNFDDKVMNFRTIIWFHSSVLEILK